MTADSFFADFIANGAATEFWFIVFVALILIVIYMGVENGIERVSKIIMPVLAVLAVVICVYSMTRPGAMAGVRYFLIPQFSNFSWMTVVAATGQLFFSLSIAMGILITFGSYMRKDISIEKSTNQVEFSDTVIAVLAGLMIIPAVFAFAGGNPETLQAGPSLMFITMPSIFASMGFGRAIGILFFVLVLFAALTSAIALTESAVAALSDRLGWSRAGGTTLMAAIIIGLGSLSALGYGPLAFIKIIGMPFLDFFDFLTNSVMMPIAALATCLLVTRSMGMGRLEEEVMHDGHPFRRRRLFKFMIRWLCPVLIAVILLSSVANAFGIIHI